MRLNGRCNHLGIALEEGNGLRHRAVAVGIVTLVRVVGQPAHPVGREEPQGIPALGLPGVGHLAPLEDDMVDGVVGEAPAHGQPGVAGPDDDHGSTHASSSQVPHAAGQATSTVMLVGFVMMS